MPRFIRVQGRKRIMRTYQIILLSALSFILLTCSLFEPAEDTTAPELFLLSPNPGETVSETVAITVSASDEEGMAGTELYINQMATGVIDTVPPYTYYWDTSPLQNGTSYQLYVRGWDINDNYANSDTISVTVDNSQVHPAAVENVGVAYQSVGYVINWTPTTHSRFSSYNLLRSSRSDMDSSNVIFNGSNPETGSYFDAGANPLLRYYYQINVIDTTGYVAESVVVPSPDPEVFYPSFLTATPSDTTIRLRWNDKSNFEESFILERDGGDGYTLLATIPANSTSYLDHDLEYDLEYRYRITIVYNSVASGWTNVASAHSPLYFRPTEIFATATSSSIQVRWTDVCIFEDGFILERDAGLGFVEIADLPANSNFYEDTDLGYDVSYRYRVAAYTDSMQSTYSLYSYVASPLEFAPENIATTATDTSIVVTWQDPCLFETGFHIERSEGTGYVQIASVGANITTYTDVDLAEDQSYHYRVRAYTPDLLSNYTTSVGIYSPIQFAPSNLTATSLDTSIVLRWDDNCIFEDGFVLERDAGSGYEVIAGLFENITSFEDTEMAYGIVYRYRVAAVEGARQSTYSYPVSRTSPLQFAPTSLSVNQSGNGLQLTWNDNCIFEDGYLIERDAGAGFVTFAELPPNSTSYLDQDMDYDVLYRYRVAARWDDVLSSFSYTASHRSPLHFAPTDVAATSTDTSITVYWQDDCIFEDGFIIERNQGSGYIQVGSVSSDITSFVDTDLEEGAYYYYRVAATSGELHSEYAFSVSIGSPISFAPTALSAFPISNSVVIQWYDNCSFESGFTLERDAGSGFEEIASLAANFTSYTDNDLSYGIQYRYRVAAFTGSDLSAYSNLVTVNSPLTFAPSGLNLSTTPTSIELTWIDNSIFETGFIVERDEGAGFVQIVEVAADASAYSDTDILEDRTYRYRVAAITETLQSSYTAIATMVSPIEFAPVSFFAIAQTGSMSLSWTDNCVFEEGFIIERDDGTGFVEIADLGANYTFYTDTDLAYNTLYSYRVAAYTSEQQSNYSNIATLNSIVELAPSNLTATAMATEINLSWVDNSVVEDGFRVERSAGGSFSQIAEVTADVTEYTDYTASYGVQYSYRVLAFVGGQSSEYTNQASASIGWLTAEWDVVSAGTYSLGHADVASGTFEHVIPADYEIMRYEVTNAQYATFLAEALVAGQITADADGFYDAGGANDLYYNLALTNHRILWDGSEVTIAEGFDLYPVSGVTWYGADAFASYYGWSLPTDEEWEVAARADTEADYPWGNSDPTCEQANFSGCNAGFIPVGQTSGISPFGVYDMAGNAWEWTSSFFDGANDSYSFRGGSWSYYSDNMKIWFRTEGVPSANYSTIGFRCVR